MVIFSSFTVIQYVKERRVRQMARKRPNRFVESDDQRLSYCVTNVVVVLSPLPTD